MPHVRIARSPWVALTALCLPMLIVSMDVSVLFFAVPFIAADLNPSPAQQLWIFDVYGFVLAGLLLTMGSLADRFGHRRVLMWGAVGFSGASLLAAFSSTPEMLIIARAVLAVAGATLMPSTLALIRHVFDDDAARAKAVATWNAVLAGGVALGPIIFGVLLEHFWWGSVFLINIPVMVALLIAAPLLLPGHTAVPGRRIDVLSALMAFGTILPVIYAIKEIAAAGWSPGRLAIGVVGVVLGVAVVRRQRRLGDPMLDLALLGERRFAASIWTNLICMFALLGNSIMVTQYLQSVLGFSPLRAALWSVVPSLFVAVAAPTAAVAAGRFGRPAVMVGGLVVAACGFALLAALIGQDSLLVVLVASTLLAGGIVATTSVIADHVVGIAPADRAGATSGLLETSSELGGALGIALLGSVLNAVYRVSYPAGVGPLEAGRSLAGASAVAHREPAEMAAQILDAARGAFVDGMAVVAWVGAGILVVTAVLIVWAARTPSVDRLPTVSEGVTDRDRSHLRAERGGDQ
ncbi:MFS transporter [Gordonia polyisoprenivorans]|uniref:MFS transporter n=1 Tax=Gordonia polyisoprenivorans TaxID=84595 RepID=UPI002011CF18|nr:MFS transporter [Gordonia polyisoprenivorans]